MTRSISKRLFYNNELVQYNLIRQMQNREVVFMGKEKDFNCLRCLWITTPKFLQTMFEFTRLYDKTYNIYISVAKYKFIPKFAKAEERKKSVRKWFCNVPKYAYEYDLLLDFDSGNGITISKMRKETYMFSNILDTNKIYHTLFPSSDKGYQIVIPSEIINIEKNFLGNNPFNEKIRLLTEKIKKTFKLQSLDLSNIGVLTKIRKCPYTIVDNTITIPIYTVKKSNSMSFNTKNIKKALRYIEMGKLQEHKNIDNIDIMQKRFKYFCRLYRL